ncbi:MAG TPA: hypothetical protein VHU42_02240, partial [Rhodopila sp.]|nr:hypothetical protein [Rhodopila sp.]
RFRRTRALTAAPTELTTEECAELEAELAAARRGELASEAEVAAMYAKHGPGLTRRGPAVKVPA